MPEKIVKKRLWSTIVYPDSAPEDFVDIIASWLMPCALSPCHCADKETDFDYQSKPHYHLIMYYEGPVPEYQAQELSDQLSGCKVKAVKSFRAYTRYLIHLDHPEKEQFPHSMPLIFGGYDLSPITQDLSDDIEYNEVFSLISFIEENKITEPAELIHFCYVDKQFSDKYFRYILNRSHFIKMYLDSKRHCFNDSTCNFDDIHSVKELK